MRIDNALAWAAKQLEGGESPSVDAKVILANILGKSQTYLFTWPDKTLADTERTLFEVAVAKRKRGEPVAYIIGKRDFWTLSLFTSPDTLIPRPDTEVLVKQVLNWANDHLSHPLSICDLGTGTGAIALALACERPDWQLLGCDVQPEAVALAERNRQRHQLSNVEIVQSSW